MNDSFHVLKRQRYLQFSDAPQLKEGTFNHDTDLFVKFQLQGSSLES